jgi:predicted Zn-dependent protease
VDTPLGQYAEAMRWFDLALARIVQDPRPSIWAGETADQFGMTAEAERRLRTAVSVAPDQWGALYFMSAFLNRHGRAGEAVPYLERIADDNNCSVLSLLSEGYSALGQTQRAADVRQHAAVACR